VRSNVEKLKGNIQIDSNLGAGCSFRIEISTSLASLTVLVFEVQGIVHAIPLEYVQTTLFVALDEIAIADGKETILWEDKPIAVASLADLLELSNYPAKLDPKFSTNPLVSGIKKDEIGGGSLKQTWYEEQPTNLRYCILIAY
jgi:two-component system, chemotaxis family, sensor kinase CheA